MLIPSRRLAPQIPTQHLLPENTTWDTLVGYMGRTPLPLGLRTGAATFSPNIVPRDYPLLFTLNYSLPFLKDYRLAGWLSLQCHSCDNAC